jgi:hypothetical protein
MQHLVNERPDLLNKAVTVAMGLEAGETLHWRSPLRNDDFAEYRDGSWLKVIGHQELTPSLRQFWPSLGPQWDALAVSSRQRVILVETKAHLTELVSPPCAAGPKSAARIDAALTMAKQYFKASQATSWAGSYYQYGNRLAHLFFLRKHGIDAHLVLLYLIGDQSLSLPATRSDWTSAIEMAHGALGLTAHIEAVHEVFIDVKDLA